MHCRETERGTNTTSQGAGLIDRAKERVKRGLALGRDRLEVGDGELRQIREATTIDEAVAVALAAFAIQVAIC